MKIVIANEDRTSELGDELRRTARSRGDEARTRRLSPQDSALSLRAARSEAEFVAQFERLLYIRHGVRTDLDYVPRKRGLAGALAASVRKWLWRLLRYQHETQAGQQNLLNELIIETLAWHRQLQERELDALRKRVAELEHGSRP